MKTFIQPGHAVTVPTPSGGTVSGQGYLIGSLFGIALTTETVVGAPVVLQLDGVVQVNKATAQAWTVGQRIYWDNAARNFTTTVGSNTLVGVATVAASSADTIGFVRLNAAFV